MTTVPMPGACDPYYADAEGWLKKWLADGRRDAVVFAEPQQEPWVAGATSLFAAEPARHLLYVKKCTALAPYVGRPFRYVWTVLIDDEGRAVAGEAEITYTMDEITVFCFTDWRQ